MGKFTFIVGGTRSGKSRYAQDLAKNTGKKVAFIATCVPRDKEMKKRIAIHKKLRPKSWKIIEESENVKQAVRGLKNQFDVVVIDCLGLLVSNFLLGGLTETRIKREIKSIAKTLSAGQFDSIVVSNEVGSGIIPDNAIARRFADLLGVSNQIMSRYANTVYIMQSGIPVKIKERRNYEQAKRND